MTYMALFAWVATYFLIRQILKDISEFIFDQQTKQWNKGWVDGRTYEQNNKKKGAK